MSDDWLKRAEAACALEVRRLIAPTEARLLLSLVAAIGGVSMALVAARLSSAFAERPTLRSLWALIAVFTVVGFFAALAWTARRARARIRAEIGRAARRPGARACTRCGEGFSEVTVPSRRRCAQCGAQLLHLHGMCVVQIDDAALQRARWRGAVRRRLRHVAPARLLAPPLWLGIATMALAMLWVAGAALAGTLGPDSLGGGAPMASLSETTDVAQDGVARARGVVDSGGPVGAATRPRAPIRVATQILARVGRGPYFSPGVIARVSEGRAFVVFADGDTAWVGPGALLAPELVPGDALEVYRAGRFVSGRLEAQNGAAVRVGGRWTSLSQVRVRLDARRGSGDARGFQVSGDAWVEAQRDSRWRPGVVVGVQGSRTRVVFADGVERWLPYTAVRPQRLDPGTWVLVEERPGRWIIGSRVGHALAIVGTDGRRGWTAVSRVLR